MRPFYVFDMDMTLADNTARAKKFLVDPRKKDYDGYYRDVSVDPPIRPMLDLMGHLWDTGADVQIWTSRRASCWNGTHDWLLTHSRLSCFRLLEDEQTETEYLDEIGVKMRPWPERQPRPRDYEIKERWLLQRRPDLVFDDRDRVVAMYREHGIIVCQPASGDF